MVKPLGECRPAWKVLRVLGNTLGLAGFEQETAAEVLAQALGPVTGEGARFAPAEQLSNTTKAQPTAATGQVGEPVVASIYQLDSMVRRATSLQLTADARSQAPIESQEVSA